jgi:hypothetical protein
VPSHVSGGGNLESQLLQPELAVTIGNTTIWRFSMQIAGEFRMPKSFRVMLGVTAFIVGMFGTFAVEVLAFAVITEATHSHPTGGRPVIFLFLIPIAVGAMSYRAAGRLLELEAVQEKIAQFAVSTKARLQVLIGANLFYLSLFTLYMVAVRPFGHLWSRGEWHTVIAWCLVPVAAISLFWFASILMLRPRPNRPPRAGSRAKKNRSRQDRPPA